jgi:hypothetical protein
VRFADALNRRNLYFDPLRAEDMYITVRLSDTVMNLRDMPANVTSRALPTDFLRRFDTHVKPHEAATQEAKQRSLHDVIRFDDPERGPWHVHFRGSDVSESQRWLPLLHLFLLNLAEEGLLTETDPQTGELRPRQGIKVHAWDTVWNFQAGLEYKLGHSRVEPPRSTRKASHLKPWDWAAYCSDPNPVLYSIMEKMGTNKMVNTLWQGFTQQRAEGTFQGDYSQFVDGVLKQYWLNEPGHDRTPHQEFLDAGGNTGIDEEDVPKGTMVLAEGFDKDPTKFDTQPGQPPAPEDGEMQSSLFTTPMLNLFAAAESINGVVQEIVAHPMGYNASRGTAEPIKALLVAKADLDREAVSFLRLAAALTQGGRDAITNATSILTRMGNATTTIRHTAWGFFKGSNVRESLKVALVGINAAIDSAKRNVAKAESFANKDQNQAPSHLVRHALTLIYGGYPRFVRLGTIDDSGGTCGYENWAHEEPWNRAPGDAN